MDSAKKVIQNISNLQNVQTHYLEYESGLKLLKVLSKIEGKEQETMENQEKSDSTLNKKRSSGYLQQSPSTRKISDIIIPDSNNSLKRGPLPLLDNQKVFKLRKIVCKTKINLDSFENFDERVKFDEIFFPKIDEFYSEIKIKHAMKMVTILYTKYAKQNIENPNLLLIIDSDKKLIESLKLNEGILFETMNYWLNNEYLFNSKNRYFAVLEKIIEILSNPEIITTILFDGFGEIWIELINKIPLINANVFDYLYLVNNMNINQKTDSVYLREFKDLILKNRDNESLALYGLSCFLKLNNNQAYKIVNKHFLEIDLFYEEIVQQAHQRLEFMKVNDNEENNFIDSLASAKFFLSLLQKLPFLMEKLFANFSDFNNGVQEFIIKKMNFLLNQITIENDIILIIFQKNVNCDNLILNTIEYFKDKNIIDEEILDEIIDYIIRKKKMNLVFQFLKNFNDNQVCKLIGLLKNMNDEIKKELMRRLIDEKRELANHFFLYLHLQIEPFNDENALKHIKKMIKFFISDEGLNKQECLKFANNYLEIMDDISTLFMGTLNLIYKVFSSREEEEEDIFDNILDVIRVMIHKEVWKNETVWNGVIQIFLLNLDKSINVIEELPDHIKNDIFSKT